MNPNDPAIEQIEAQSDAVDVSAIDEVSDEQALAEAPQFALPTLTLPLAGLPVRVISEQGEKALVVGPVLVNFVLPFSAEGARGIAAELTGGIEVADMSDVAARAKAAGFEVAR